MGGKPKPEQPSESEVQADRIRKKYMDEIENDTSPVKPYDFSGNRGKGRRGSSFSELMGGGNSVASGGNSGASGKNTRLNGRR